MAEIINLADIPRKTCSTCFWHDGPNGACKRPGGYNFNWKLNLCRSWTPARKEEGLTHGHPKDAPL